MTTKISEPLPGKKLRVLVTGGAGFLGSHLVDRLMEQGHEVICLDSFVSGRKSNVLKWIGNPRFELVRHDVTEHYKCEVDRIYHLACPASPVHYQCNPIKTMKTNVLGTLNMCGLAKRTGARLLLASTSEVYGDPEVHPQREEYVGSVSCIGSRACYDEGKRAAEALMFDYHRQNGVEVRVVRIFNTYGPRMLFHDGRVISNFIVQALRREGLTVYGDGSQTRSFCYVDDLVEAMMRMMEQTATVGPVNIGNPGEYTIRQLAESVRRLVGGDLPAVVYRSLPSDDPKRRQPDISRAREFLDGWEPTVKLEDGLRKTVEDFRKRAEQYPDDLFCMHQKEAVVAPPAKRARQE